MQVALLSGLAVDSEFGQQTYLDALLEKAHALMTGNA
jgi:hypothetical protein